jgi:hypothetical protein
MSETKKGRQKQVESLNVENLEDRYAPYMKTGTPGRDGISKKDPN